jgi:hypothetical protein
VATSGVTSPPASASAAARRAKVRDKEDSLQ